MSTTNIDPGMVIEDKGSQKLKKLGFCGNNQDLLVCRKETRFLACDRPSHFLEIFMLS
ncbi:MAG: hypothetical protein F6K10_25660 [Moorea sp. SIO2B7]|nr:hypothetical protein [Moorena sp. SIO2B7]